MSKITSVLRHSRRKWLANGSLGVAAVAAGCLSRAGNAAEPAESVGQTSSTKRWPFEVTSGIFQIHADFEITPRSSFIGELDRLVGDVGRLLGTPAPTASMHMVLFGRSEDYRRYMEHYYPQVPERRALFIQQRGTAMLFAHRHADMTTDLRHESVHGLLNESHATLPLWLDEGLAEYFEVPAGDRWSGHPHLAEIKQCQPPTLVQLERLEELDQVADMTVEHYRDAWSWVHFLIHRRPSTRRLLLEQLEACRAARSVLPLSRTVALHVPQLHDQWHEHFSALESPFAPRK